MLTADNSRIWSSKALREMNVVPCHLREPFFLCTKHTSSAKVQNDMKGYEPINFHALCDVPCTAIPLGISATEVIGVVSRSAIS